jgi:hypothetical protein
MELAMRHGALRERIAAQRRELAGHAGPLKSAASMPRVPRASSIPGTQRQHSQKKLYQPSVSTSQPAEALMKVRGTAARLVNSAICVAV